MNKSCIFLWGSMKSQHYTAKGKFTKKMHQGFLLEASEELHSYKKGEKILPYNMCLIFNRSCKRSQRKTLYSG